MAVTIQVITQTVPVSTGNITNMHHLQQFVRSHIYWYQTKLVCYQVHTKILILSNKDQENE